VTQTMAPPPPPPPPPHPTKRGKGKRKAKGFVEPPTPHTSNSDFYLCASNLQTGGEEKKEEEPLIQVNNPNRNNKTAAHIKASALSKDAKPELSRRERSPPPNQSFVPKIYRPISPPPPSLCLHREAIEKERKRKQYQEAYASGKTPEVPPHPHMWYTQA